MTFAGMPRGKRARRPDRLSQHASRTSRRRCRRRPQRRAGADAAGRGRRQPQARPRSTRSARAACRGPADRAVAAVLARVAVPRLHANVMRRGSAAAPVAQPSKNRHNRLSIVALIAGRPEHCMRLTRRAVLRTGAAALAAPAVDALDGLVRRRPRWRRSAQRAWQHGLSLFGDLKYPAGFKHFDYVNAERAEGRRRAADRVRHLRQFQPGGGRREGLARRRHRPDLRHADGVGARRGRRPNTACWPKRSAIRRIFPRSPIACAPTPSGTTASRSRSRT